MQEALTKLIEINTKQTEQITELLIENRLLNQKIQALMNRLFGRKSEKLDKRQLELLLGELAALDDDHDDDLPPSAPPRSRKKRKPLKPRLPEDLPTQTVTLDPEEVKADPEAYTRIGEEVTEELDVVPNHYFRRLTIRGKYVKKADRSRPPIIAPLEPRLIEGSYASAGLLTDIMLKKYVDHLPLCRQERIMKERFGIELSRSTMSDWVWATANWLKLIYGHIREDLRKTEYLQVDETPVRYLAEEGGSAQGYFWIYHHPGGDVLYEWHTSRATTCLDEMLEGFKGTIQSDGYRAYTKYARENDGIKLAGCWAHARRKFREAQDEAPKLAGWFLNQIGQLYGIERKLRIGRCSPKLRKFTRSLESVVILERLEKALKLKLPQHLPRSQMGKAIAYALGHWKQLTCYAQDGRLEIDNNLVENAVRPTAVGKKNWLFIGHPEAGQRSAIIYTILETCKRHGINPAEYLKDVLERLPSMTNQQTPELTPVNWLAARQKKAA